MKTAIPLSLCLTLLCSCSGYVQGDKSLPLPKTQANSPQTIPTAAITPPASIPAVHPIGPAARVLAPIALVYIQVANGVDVYSEVPDGTLTTMSGSPFSVSGQMEGITGSVLLSVGTNDLHSYPISSDGSVGQQSASVDTASNDGEQCGPTTGFQAVLDRTGQTFYVQLGSLCPDTSDWQSYAISPAGDFTFLGNSYTSGYGPTSTLTFDSLDDFGYALSPAQDDEMWFSVFPRSSNGDITDGGTPRETDPEPAADYYLEPISAVADSSGHLAAFMAPLTNCDDSCLPYGTGGPNQLASYTVDPVTHAIASTNTTEDAPVLQAFGSLSMSPDGKYVAADGLGFQVFNFNGADVPTQLTALKLQGTRIDQLAWDGADHLFALSYSTGALYVFSVSAQGVTQIGEPVSVPGAYGLTGIIVVNK